MEDFCFKVEVSRNTILTTRLLGNTLVLAAFKRRFFKRRDITRWINDPSPLGSLVLGPLTRFALETDGDTLTIFTRTDDSPIASFNATVVTYSSLTDWLTKPRSFQQILNASVQELAAALEYNDRKYYFLSSPHTVAD